MNRNPFSSYGYGSSNSRSDSMEAELEEYREELSRIKSMPTPRAVVVDINFEEKIVLIAAGSGSVLEIPLPPERISKRLKVGDTVRCLSETMAILDITKIPAWTGEIATVKGPSLDGYCEVDHNGKIKVVRHGFSEVPENGDRVILDSTGSVAIKSLGSDESKFSFEGSTGISWDDIGGLEKAKSEMREALELPYQYKELYAKYGRKPVNGIMLFGAAGCGKTLLAKAAATSMSKIHGKTTSKSGFIYVKGPELLDKFVGQTEAQIRGLFARARFHHKKFGYPSILFIDEADALLGKRGARLNMGTETTVVPQFLSEMDGLHESGCIVLLATNRPDSLDPAVVREGRVDIKVHVQRPDQKDSQSISNIYLKKKPLRGMNSEEASSLLSAEIFDRKYVIYEVKLKNLKKEIFTLGNLSNGAMIARIVEKAATSALQRDISRNEGANGITRNDLITAVQDIFEQNLRINHDNDVDEFCEHLGEIESIKRPDKKRLVELIS